MCACIRSCPAAAQQIEMLDRLITRMEGDAGRLDADLLRR